MTGFRVVQPWGPGKAREATVISEHPTARPPSRRSIGSHPRWCGRARAPSDAVELIVVDQAGVIVQQTGVQ